MKQYVRRPDYILLISTFTLTLIGLLMILSASFDFGYLQKQLIAMVLGLIALGIGMIFDYHHYRRLVTPLILVSIGLLVLTYVPAFSHTAGGASRWLRIGGFVFQPSELAKLTAVIFMAMGLDNKRNQVHDFWKGTFPLLLVVGLMLALIIKQPDLGTTILISVTIGFMLFIGGLPIWHLLLMSAIGFRAVYWVIEHNPYQKDRIMAFLDPWKHYLGVGFHTVQSLLAVGSGGIFGLGLGNSRQKFSYLPQPYTDYIYAIICEELGLLGALLVVALFIVFAIRGIRIARIAPDRFGMLLAFGITCWIVFEALLNIGVVLGGVPPTGIPLVFVSYGGSSLIVSLFAVGILVNISRQGA